MQSGNRRIYVAALAIAALLGAACGSRGGESSAERPPAPDQEQLLDSLPSEAPLTGESAGEEGDIGGAEEASGAPADEAEVASSEPAATEAAPAAKSGRGEAAKPSGSKTAPPAGRAGSSDTGSSKGSNPSSKSPSSPSPRPESSSAPAPGDLSDAIRIPGPSSQGVTDKEIKVGILAPLSGYAGFLGQEQVDGIKAYLSDVNEKGGVRGRKYRLVVADTRFEPQTEAIGARRLVEQEKVFALFTAISAESMAAYGASTGIPTIMFGIIPPGYASKFPNVYPVGLHTVDSVVQMAYTLTQVKKLPIKSVAIVYETANLPWDKWVGYAKKAWEYFGVEVKSVDRFNLSDGDCTQLVLKVQALNIDFWQVGQSLGWPLCQQAMTRQNYTPRFGRGGPYSDDILWGNQMGAGYDGVYAQTNGVQIAKNKGEPWPYDPSGKAPEVDHFVQTMKKFSPKSAEQPILEGIWTQNFWAEAKLLNEAVKRQVDALTWRGVNQWIQSQRNWNSGLVSPGSFDPKCKTGASQVWIYQAKWNAKQNSVEEGDWQDMGGVHPIPKEVKNAIVPGAGDCYLTAMADAKL